MRKGEKNFKIENLIFLIDTMMKAIVIATKHCEILNFDVKVGSFFKVLKYFELYKKIIT